MKQAKVAACMGDVFEDLGLQCFGRGPLHFSAQAEEELEIEPGVIEEIDWFEIQDVGFDTEAYAFERGAIADVRDSLEAAIADGKPGHIDAESRKQAIVEREVDCGDEQLCPDATASGRIGVNAEYATKHPAGAANVSGCDCASYCGAGDFQIVNADGVVDIHIESKLLTKGTEFADSGFCSVTEAEVGAFVNSANAEAAHENVAYKIMTRNA